VGYGILFDPLLDYHLVTISSLGHGQFTELALPAVSSPSLLRRPATVKSRRTTKPASYLAYPFPDEAPLSSPGKKIRQSLRIPPGVVREKDHVSTDSIKALGDVTVKIRNALGSVLQVADGLRRRSYSTQTAMPMLMVDWSFSKRNSPHNYPKSQQPTKTSKTFKQTLNLGY